MTRLLALVGIVGLQLLSCSSPDNPCPTNNCTVPANTVVKWMFDHYPERGFASDSCVDFGVGKVIVEAIDAGGVNHTLTDSCDVGQVTYQNLPAGDYNVYVTPVDFGGNAVVTAPTAGMVTAGSFGHNTETTVYVPYTAWIGTYTGTFLFRLTWGGMSCSMATPPVATQTLKLTVGTQVVSAMTDTMQKLDGTDPKPCRESTESFPQSAQMIPFGPGTLEAIGKDSGGTVRFQKAIDVFVGAGITNPTITYDVPVDAGIDAPPADANGDAPAD